MIIAMCYKTYIRGEENMDEILFTAASFTCNAAHAMGADGVTGLMGFGPSPVAPRRGTFEYSMWYRQQELMFMKALNPCELQHGSGAILITGALTIVLALAVPLKLWSFLSKHGPAQSTPVVENKNSPNIDR